MSPLASFIRPWNHLVNYFPNEFIVQRTDIFNENVSHLILVEEIPVRKEVIEMIEKYSCPLERDCRNCFSALAFPNSIQFSLGILRTK